MLLKAAQPAHHPVEGGPASLVSPIDVVQLPLSVQTDADEEIMFLEERTPLIGQQSAVGLHGVHDLHARPPVFLRQLHRAAIEIQAHKGGLSPLPGNDHLIGLVGFDELMNVILQQLVRHAEPAVGIEDLFVQEEAVGAVQIAGCSRGLHQQVERGRGLSGSRER